MTFRRGYFLGRRPRRKIFPARKYVPTRRPAQVRRSLFNPRPLTDRLSLQTMHENQFGNEFSVANNGSITAYITYPSLGMLEPNRHRSYIKLNRLRFNGTAQIQSTQTDVIMDPSSPIPIPRLNGVLSVVIVLDRKPHMDLGSNHLDRFDEVFGANAFSHGNLQVVSRHRERYKIKYTFKCVLSVEKDSTLIKVEGSVSLSSSRYPCWASFNDFDIDSLGGNYNNLNKNALLVFYCWMSDSPSKASMFVSFDLNYLG
ncbi:hypothetical protein V6N13_054449 [Hibiscus sabdariffa]